MYGEQMTMFCGERRFTVDKPIRLIELFGGIGSQAKALHNIGADFEHYRLCEFDRYAVTSYNAIHGTNFKTSDIRQITASDLGITDTDKYCYIMTYSFPCQDLSKAGQQKGMAKGDNTRSGLLWEVERLLDECRELPQVLLMENVPDVIGTKNIAHFADWIAKLEKLGYRNYWKCLNAKNYGIPQNRERCFMVSVLGDYYYDFPKPIPLELRLKDMLESKVDEKYYIKNAKVNTLLKGLDYENANKVCCDMTINQPRFRDIANTIKARYDCGIENQRQTGTAVIEPKQEHTSNTITTVQKDNLVIEPTILQQPHGYNKGAELEMCPSITTSSWESNNFLKEPITVDTDIKQCVRKNYEREKEQIAQSDKEIYQCECESGFQDNKVGIKVSPMLRAGNSHTAVYNNYRIRKLTPLECYRLMGFDDADFYKAKAAGVSDSQLYKQAGNSIVVNVLEALFKQLF